MMSIGMETAFIHLFNHPEKLFAMSTQSLGEHRPTERLTRRADMGGEQQRKPRHVTG